MSVGGTFVAANWDAVLAAFRDEEQAVSLENFHLGLAEALGHGIAGEEVADLLGRLCLLGTVPSAATLQERNKHHADLLTALELGRLDAAVAAVKVHGACAP